MQMLRNVFVLSAFLISFLPRVASAETRPEFKADPTKLQVEAGFPTTINLFDLLSDLGTGGDLEWGVLRFDAATPIPSFVILNAVAGQITITPPLTAAGLHRFRISATRKIPGGEDKGNIAAAELTVKVFQGPKWTGNPITLPDATEDSLYSVNVNDPAYVTYNETEPLTYEVFDGKNRAWVEMSKAGILEGMPLRPNEGAVELNARVSTTHRGIPFKDETLLKFNVKLINKPPNWTQNPLVLPDAFTRQPYAPQDLKPFVTDPDRNTVFSFRIVDPATSPNWATITGTSIGGTPQNLHLGLNEWVVEVSDGQLTKLTKVQITVKNRPPKWKLKPTVLKPNAIEDSLYKAALAPHATDPESDPLTFTMLPGSPTWATINANGELEGTPRRPNDLGLQKFMIRVSDALSGGSDDAEVHVIVDKINKPPKWTLDDIVLPEAPERSPYSQTLSQFVTDPDNDTPLTYRKVNPAEGNWITIGMTGTVTGTPQRQHLGEHVVSVEVKDPGGLTAVTRIHITVTKVNRPPVCQNPAALKDALQEAPFTDDVNRLVSDPDTDKLTFKPITVPGWMTAATDGKLTGTPQEANIGNYRAEFEVTDPDGAMCKLIADGRVLRANWKPEIKEPIQFTVKERQIFTVSLKDPKYVEDKDPADVLTFLLVDPPPPWVTLTTVGALTLKPEFEQIGTHSFKFTVSDGKVTIPGTFTVIVVRDPRPPQWLQNTIRFTATAEVPFVATLKDKVQDLDGLPLTFTPMGAPAWLSVATDGGLTGTPLEANVGLNTFKVRAANDALGADVTVIIDVKSANTPPKWTRNPIILPDATVGENYTQRLSDFATDADPNDRLTFKLLTPSPWIFLTTSGLFFGTPAMTDLGLNKPMVQVTDGKATADVEVHVRVVNKNQRPKWTKDPIDLGTAFVGKPFTFNLVGLVTDPDGPTLTFRKMPGAQPMWLQVSAGGQVFGTPAETDVGAYTTVLEVSDNGIEWVAVNAFGKVVKESTPPKLNASALFFTVRANEIFNERLNQALYVTYTGDRTRLRFELLQTDPWVKLAVNGDLELRPKDPEIGDHSYTLKVTDTDTNLSDQAPLRIKVIPGKQVPKWTEDPIRYEAIVNKPFSASLLAKVSNPDGVSLTFAKGSGKPWLSVPSNGLISGTPLTADLGENFFTVSFTWDGGTVNATLIVKVIPDGPNDDSVIIDEPVPGARSDNLWIVDNNRDQCSGQSCFIQELRDSIDAFYNEMERARIEHYGIYLSADACTYRSPIRDSRNQVLLVHGDRNWVSSFNSRISKSPSDPTWNSPLTALWQFLFTSVTNVPTPYFEARVPMDVIMMSPNNDRYSNFTHHTAPHWQTIAGWTPSRFLEDAVGVHKFAEKSLRISALAINNSAYQTMVNGTRVPPSAKGTYFTYKSSQMEDQLYQYAQEVIFRAYVTAKKRIKLSKTPTDPTSISVTIGGRKLATNQWSYDRAANEVEIYWHLIDMSQLKPGERLVVQYR